jgi:glutathione S-transferase
MKLYYYPGACSLAAHIVLREGGFAFDLEKVDLTTGKTETGAEFRAINPKGYVPALVLDEGQLLSEAQVILQYLADQRPDSGLAPPAGSMERYRLMEWLAFIATEVHKGFGPLWNPATPEAMRQAALTLLAKRFDFLETALAGKDWLMGDCFTVADAYLCTVLGWTAFHKVDLAPWPVLTDYLARAGARPAVLAAMRAEGLVG